MSWRKQANQQNVRAYKIDIVVNMYYHVMIMPRTQQGAAHDEWTLDDSRAGTHDNAHFQAPQVRRPGEDAWRPVQRPFLRSRLYLPARGHTTSHSRINETLSLEGDETDALQQELAPEQSRCLKLVRGRLRAPVCRFTPGRPDKVQE